jgi:hypothetical protein
VKKSEIDQIVPTLNDFLTDLTLYNIKQQALDSYKNNTIRYDAPDLFVVTCYINSLVRELESNGLEIKLVKKDENGSTD